MKASRERAIDPKFGGRWTVTALDFAIRSDDVRFARVSVGALAAVHGVTRDVIYPIRSCPKVRGRDGNGAAKPGRAQAGSNISCRCGWLFPADGARRGWHSPSPARAPRRCGLCLYAYRYSGG